MLSSAKHRGPSIVLASCSLPSICRWVVGTSKIANEFEAFPGKGLALEPSPKPRAHKTPQNCAV